MQFSRKFSKYTILRPQVVLDLAVAAAFAVARNSLVPSVFLLLQELLQFFEIFPRRARPRLQPVSPPLSRVALCTIRAVEKYKKRDDPRRFTLSLAGGERVKLRAPKAHVASQWMADLESARQQAAD